MQDCWESKSCSHPFLDAGIVPANSLCHSIIALQKLLLELIMLQLNVGHRFTHFSWLRDCSGARI